MHTGQITRGLRPSWEPLNELVGRDLVPGFMWTYALSLDDGATVHAYRNVSTRRLLHLSEDGRAFVCRPGLGYEEQSPSAALQDVFAGWEEAVPQPKKPEAVRALLERAQAA
ncbi:MAG TPA: hypothetical protein VNS09_15225 [Solirubrobacter sp.]|nr:hypothetical protein [Solirubrobacter sp.]